MPKPHHPSAAARRVLSKLGTDIREARRRRGLPMAVVLQALGLLEGLGEVADISRDLVGQALASEALPQRMRLKRIKS